MEVKECNKCTIEYPLSFFSKNKGAKDGHKNQCKKCVGKYSKEYIKLNPDKAKKYYYAHQEECKKRCSEYGKRNRKKRTQYQCHRYKTIAEVRNKVRVRIYTARFIKILKSDYCVECGSKTNLHRHHPDYNNPLKIIILCRKCHRSLHNLCGKI